MPQDAEYIFRNCTPNGATQVMRVRPGGLLDRDWSFRVNAPVERLQGLNNQAAPGTLDPRRIARGYDGRLYDADTGEFLAQVNTFEVRLDPNTTDYQPSGVRQVYAVPTSFTVTLTFTETEVTHRLLQKLVDGMQENAPDPIFNFRGKLTGR